MSDHEPVPHVDRDGSECLSMAQHFGIAQDVWDRGIEEIRARMEREHERGLAAYVPEDEADEVERLRAEVETWRARYEVADDEAKAAEAALAEERALVDRLNRLLGSHADGHRCTCTMLDPGVYHGENMHPPAWEQDPWCPTHPEADYIRQQYEAMSHRAEKAEAALARVEALADQIEARAAMNRQAAENHQHDPKRTSFVMVSRAHASELDQQAAALRAALRGPDAEVTE